MSIDRRQLLKSLAALPGAVVVDRTGLQTGQAFQFAETSYAVFISDDVLDAQEVGAALEHVLPEHANAVVVPVKLKDGQRVEDVIAIYPFEEK